MPVQPAEQLPDEPGARAPGSSGDEPLVAMRGISKRFGHIQAVDGVDFSVAHGEIHALLGENGAGKSTLMNIAYGLVRPDTGEVLLRGEHLKPGDPAAALRAGIGMVHQHFKLVPSLTVAENIFLGREETRGLFLQRRKAIRLAEALSERYGLRVTATATVADLAVGERQRVEILRILSHGPELVVLDEPTAVLAPQEVGDLFDVIHTLRAGGRSVVIVTHKLDEVRAVADRFSVMRRGEMVATLPAAGVSEAEMAALMVGRTVKTTMRAGRAQTRESALALEGVSFGLPGEQERLSDVSLEVRGGEIVGIAGVEGNGQAELAELVVGLKTCTAGRVRMFETDVTEADAETRRRMGLAYVPEDRFDRGSCPSMSIADNLAIANVDNATFTRGPFVRRNALHAWARQTLDAFDVRGAEDTAAPMLALSGGNMQKVMLARELVREPRALVASQPCRGVDVGAVAAIHRMLLDQRDNGLAILLLSTELSEILALSDRVLVLFRGRIVAELDGGSTSREEIGLHMLGSTENGKLAS